MFQKKRKLIAFFNWTIYLRLALSHNGFHRTSVEFQPFGFIIFLGILGISWTFYENKIVFFRAWDILSAIYSHAFSCFIFLVFSQIIYISVHDFKIQPLGKFSPKIYGLLTLGFSSVLWETALLQSIKVRIKGVSILKVIEAMEICVQVPENNSSQLLSLKTTYRSVGRGRWHSIMMKEYSWERVEPDGTTTE